MTDETVVAMEWLLSAAVGGIKVQVREEDVERAVAELERAFGANGEGFPKTGDEPPAVGDEAGAEDDPPEEEAFATSTGAADADPDEPTPEPTEREQYARRAFYAALFGIVMPVLLFYAT